MKIKTEKLALHWDDMIKSVQWSRRSMTYYLIIISNINSHLIRKTCPCKVYPLEPHFYIAKLGYTGVYLFLLQNIDCGYPLEPPRRVPTIYVMSENKKNINIFLLKNFIFRLKKSLFIALASFRNVLVKIPNDEMCSLLFD